MKFSKQNLQWLAIGLVIVVPLLVIFSQFVREMRWVEEHVGLQGEARVDKLRALNRVLTARGIDAREIQSLESIFPLPPNTDVIVSHTSSHYIPDHQLEQLLNWVEGGGHLIMLSNHREDDKLLEQLGIKQIGPFKKNTVFSTGSNKDVALEGIVEPNWRLKTTDHDHASLHFWMSSDAKSAVAVQQRRGYGLLTVANSLAFMHSTQLGKKEHLEIALALVDRGLNQTVWLQSRPSMPSLWKLIYQHAWQVLLALLLLTIFYIWSRGLRHGSLLVEQRHARHSLQEHLSASAKFIWRAGDRCSLLLASYQVAVDDTHHKHPETKHLDNTELNSWWQHHCEINDTAITQLSNVLHVEGTIKLNEATFTQIMQTLQLIRKKL